MSHVLVVSTPGSHFGGPGINFHPGQDTHFLFILFSVCRASQIAQSRRLHSSIPPTINSTWLASNKQLICHPCLRRSPTLPSPFFNKLLLCCCFLYFNRSRDWRWKDGVKQSCYVHQYQSMFVMSMGTTSLDLSTFNQNPVDLFWLFIVSDFRSIRNNSIKR